ncbi:uncharacterized protein TNCV_2547171 [Trichonephila clavipes]|nr:uncharacterized protein TNCV_2547171 [Trichonephila clavipes]
MKQKQTKNKHSGSACARSDQCIMDMQNRLKSTLEDKISRIEMFIKSANEETNSVEIKVKLRTLIQLQKNVEELRKKYYAILNVKDAELTAVDEDLHLLEVPLESLEVRIETILNSSKKSSSGAVMKTNDNFEIKTKIPPLVLPEFSGKYEEFSSFKIQFDDLITNNILLSESQKLYYLRSCLTHEVNYLCIEKLDREPRRNFELSHKSKTVPTFQELIEFLEQRGSVLLSVSVDRNAKVKPNKMYANNSKPKAFIVNENKNKNCIVCAGIGVFSHLFFYLHAGPLTTHFDGEVEAIHIALQQLAVYLPPIEKAVILSDSTSALQALSNYNENNCLRVQNCRELLGKIKGKIVFQWVPSHCGLWGNERADFLAKKGTGILQNFRRDLTLHSAKLEIKRIFRESFRITASRVARDKP